MFHDNQFPLLETGCQVTQPNRPHGATARKEKGPPPLWKRAFNQQISNNVRVRRGCRRPYRQNQTLRAARVPALGDRPVGA
ncbi:MAG: hypothetical protein KDF25_13350, partial [Burkholderiaceae bacterium]|nr:hypothetical protein [Burkholderiaceae bacterium]